MNILDKVKIVEELKKGGQWLGACHEWIKWNITTGDRLTWGSQEVVKITMQKLEDMALGVAIAIKLDATEKPSQRMVPLEDVREFVKSQLCGDNPFVLMQFDSKFGKGE
jgi:hypothetical protein